MFCSQFRNAVVLTAARTDCNCFFVPVEVSNVEYIFVRVQIGHKKFIIGCVYIPSKSSSEVYINHFKAVKDIV